MKCYAGRSGWPGPLSAKPLQRLASICRDYGIAPIYLFGSQAQNGKKILSGLEAAQDDTLADLDVGVITERLLPRHRNAPFNASLYNDLAGLFSGFNLDLVLLEENHSVFQLEAVKAICVFQGEEKRDYYEMMILRRAADFQPFLEKYLREIPEEV